jgi:hypothetical protein
MPHGDSCSLSEKRCPRGQRQICVLSRGPWAVSIHAARAGSDRRQQYLYPWLGAFQYPMPARLSPDGKLLAYASDESGRVEVYVQSFPTPGNKVLISANGGDQPAWRRDGKELYYLAPDHKLMAVAVKPGATFDGGEPQVPFQTRAPATNLLSIRNHYAPAADGLKFLVRTMPEGQSTVPLVMVLNWASGIGKP